MRWSLRSGNQEGEAVASYDSVATPEGGESIVKTALEAFGKVDILINNAGILRDKSMVKMTSDQWESRAGCASRRRLQRYTACFYQHAQ